MRTALTQISRGKRPATGRKSSTREPRWDNARFVAGTLVVLVHMSGSLADRDGLRWLYLATWAMRVPLFAVLWAWGLLGETPTWPMLAAGALILGSVALTQRAPAAPKA